MDGAGGHAPSKRGQAVVAGSLDGSSVGSTEGSTAVSAGEAVTMLRAMPGFWMGVQETATSPVTKVWQAMR